MSSIKKKKLISLISYILIFVFLLIPMVIFQSKKYSLLTFGIHVAIDNRGYDIGVIIQSALLILYCVISILYLLSCIAGSCFRLNLLNVFIIIIFTGVHLSESSMLTLCEDHVKGKSIVYFILSLTVLELIIKF